MKKIFLQWKQGFTGTTSQGCGKIPITGCFQGKTGQGGT